MKSLEPDRSRTPSGEACTRIRSHLAQGAPWDACDAFREAIVTNPVDAELLYCGALAHARAGATYEAHTLLDRAQAAAPPAGALLADILSLRGRLWKDRLHRNPDAPDASACAERARKEYLAAWSLQHDPYPGINAATLSMLLGDRTVAQEMARTISARFAAQTIGVQLAAQTISVQLAAQTISVQLAAQEMAQTIGVQLAAQEMAQTIGVQLAAQAATPTIWDHAIAGEAALLLGQPDRARECYAAAQTMAAGDVGSVATMRRQLLLLSRVLPDAKAMLQVMRAADVVAFSGHMVDAPGRAVPRFPSALVPAVEAAVREHLADLHQPVFYGSAACGTDLIVIEAALTLGAEVNVVMPFDRDDFVRTSVAVGDDAWLARFDAALSRATRIIPATDERYLGDDVLFEHAARLVEGLAVLRASQLQTTPRLLCVIDEALGGRVGGTLSAFERWTRCVGPPEVIDLAGLRAGAPPDPRDTQRGAPASRTPSAPASESAAASMATSPAPAAPISPDPLHVEARPPRTLKTLLFADFAGYGRLHDVNAARFQGEFWAIAARQIESSASKPLFANTWGDGLFLVFESAAEGASFALRLSDAMRAVDWTAHGLPDTSQLRICLHAGPVFCAFDPIIARDNYFGSSVTRAARIEPVTPPGAVFASEAFAATLAASGQREFVLEYVGWVGLAKGVGESRVYRLAAR